MNRGVILLGSNTGDLSVNLSRARAEIVGKIGSILISSHVYETEPWGLTDQPFFLNQVIEIQTPFEATKLLAALLDIEKVMGRERGIKWAPRIIDLDILYFNDQVIDEEGIKIPHPHLHERRFTLEPLNEILPEMIHPVFKKKNIDLLNALSDNMHVVRSGIE